MQRKIPFKASALVIGISGIAFSSMLSFSLSQPIVTPIPMQNNSVGSISAQSLTRVVMAEQGRSGIPVRLKIPKIKIDSVIEPVGITSLGQLDVPKSFSNAGWFNMGTRPGEKGSSVIDGHFGLKKGIPGAFNKLNTLQKGDKIYVEDSTGTTQVFVVREFRTYDQNDVVPEVFHSDDGKAHLNLITCEGIWNISKKNYPSRLVVFTDREGE